MKRHLLLFLAVLMAALPLAAATKTWSFTWDKSKANGGTGFYNFGASSVVKAFYEAELNGINWCVKSDGTNYYAFVATNGQYIGSAGEPSNYSEVWTEGFAGKIKAIRVTAKTQKAEQAVDLSVNVNGVSYKCGGNTTAALTTSFVANEFVPDGAGQEGKLVIALQPTSEAKGPLYLKKIEVDYEEVESSVPAPVFSVAAGTYDEAQQVALTVAGVDGASIFYTTDGSNPRVEGGTRKLYAQPVTVDYTQQLKAVAKVGDDYSNVVEASYVIRRSPELSFYKTELTLTSGDDGYADLINPNKVKPVAYKSSAWNVCSVDDKGALSTSYVTEQQTAVISAVFAGDDTYLPQTVTMTVTVNPKAPLAAPTLTPEGGTFNAPVVVTATSSDDNTVTLWYSTAAKSEEEFLEASPADDNSIITVVEGKKATISIKKSCTLFVRAMGYNTVSPVVSAQYVIDEPLKAVFSTDKSTQTLYRQGFDSKNVSDWDIDRGWKLSNQGFSSIDPDDKGSAFCGYKDGDEGTTASLTSPEFTAEANSKAEFYAYFSGVFLIDGSWNVNIIDVASGESEQVFDAFRWAQANNYTGPSWNKYSFPLDNYAGKKVRVEIVQHFGGEDLAIDGFAVVKDDPTASEPINIFEGESVTFHNHSTGADAVEWAFPGGDISASAENDPTVTYTKSGSYDVTLTATKGNETDVCQRKAFVIVSKKAPKAIIGLPEEGYESPFVGLFVPLNVPVTFRDLSENVPSKWEWTFQNTDKLSSDEQNPTVTYVKKGTVSVGLRVENEAGVSTDQLNYAVQAGGAQAVWNISSEDNDKLEKVSLGYYGNYAGSNWLSIDKFAERYKAPLADATIDSVYVYFASNTTVSPDADITLTINSVGADGKPGDVLATASVKASEVKYADDDYLATTFKFAQPAAIKKGQEFFAVIGPFPNNSLEEKPYTSDDLAVFCFRRGEGGKSTTWQLVEDLDDNNQGLGTYQWFENTDDPTSMAIAPIVTYDAPETGISGVGADRAKSAPAAVFTLDGKKVERPTKGGVYIVRRADGTVGKVLVK